MKINKSQIKNLLKEVVIELISDGQIQIKQSLVNELKLSNGNLPKAKLNNNGKNLSTKNQTHIMRQIPVKRINEQQQKHVLKTSTGNPLLDEYINTAPQQDVIESNQYVANSGIEPKDMKDYSEFIKDL